MALLPSPVAGAPQPRAFRIGRGRQRVARKRNPPWTHPDSRGAPSAAGWDATATAGRPHDKGRSQVPVSYTGRQACFGVRIGPWNVVGGAGGWRSASSQPSRRHWRGAPQVPSGRRLDSNRGRRCRPTFLERCTRSPKPSPKRSFSLLPAGCTKVRSVLGRWTLSPPPTGLVAFEGGRGTEHRMAAAILNSWARSRWEAAPSLQAPGNGPMLGFGEPSCRAASSAVLMRPGFA